MITLERERVGNLSLAPRPTLGELRSELAYRADRQDDIIVKPKDIRMNDAGNMVVKGEEFELNQHAFTQVANKLHIPTPYLKRCEPELQAINVNAWLKTRENSLLIRTEDNHIRSVLSERYRMINHWDILEWLSKDMNNSTQIRYELTEKYMNIQVVAGNNLDDSQDILHSGIDIRNSEVGAAAVSIGAMVYRTICLNGLIMSGGKWEYSRKHVGKNDITQVIRNAYNKALTTSRQAKDSFDGMRGIKVSKPVETLETIAKRYSFTSEQERAIKEAFYIEPDNTMFGVVNALTRAGNNTTLTVDSRHSLQKTGGRITELVSAGNGKWIDN